MQLTSTTASFSSPLPPRAPTGVQFVSTVPGAGTASSTSAAGRQGYTFSGADFTVRGPAGNYVVELWMEEPAPAKRSSSSTRRKRSTFHLGAKASGKFDRHGIDVPPAVRWKVSSLSLIPLGYYWSYRLILKRP